MGHSIHAEVMLVLSFYIIAPGVSNSGYQGLQKHLYLLSHLSSLQFYFLRFILFTYVCVYIFVCVYAHFSVDALIGQRRASIPRSWSFRQF